MSDEPLSRWQRLYSSKPSPRQFPISNDQSSYQQINDLESISAWVEGTKTKESEISYHQGYFESENQNINHQDVMKENEVEGILEYMDSILSANNEFDDDMINSIIESQIQQDEIDHFHRKKYIRNMLQTWKRYTKSQLEKNQLIIGRYNDLRSHHLVTGTFKAWKVLSEQARAVLDSKMKIMKTKRLGCFFCSFTKEILAKLQTIKVFQESHFKAKVIRTWMKVIQERNLLATRLLEKNITRKYLVTWKESYKISKDAISVANKKSDQTTMKEEGGKQPNHHLKVTELLHFLDGDEMRLNKENIPQDVVHDELEKINAFGSQWQIKDRNNNCKLKKNGLSCPKPKKGLNREQSANNRRTVLKEKHTHAKLNREAEATKAMHKKDEEERNAYLKRKHEEKTLKQKRKRELEMARKAWNLAKLHHSLVILKRYFCVGWKSRLHKRKFLWKKATTFSEYRLKSRCIMAMVEYAKEREKKKSCNADMYHHLGMLERVLRHWTRIASQSHHVFYEKVVRNRVYYSQCRLMNIWKTQLQMQLVRTIEMENKAMKFAEGNQLRWIMRKFKMGVLQLKREQVENEIVKMKWEKIKTWLENS